MEKLIYNVAGHHFGIVSGDADKIRRLLPSYENFICDSEYNDELLFVVNVVCCELIRFERRIDTFFIDGGEGLVCSGEKGFSFDIFDDLTRKIVRFNTDKSFRNAEIFLSDMDLHTASFGLNNAIMIMYAFSAASHKTLLVHSSVVVNDSSAYLFLGKSGTGKSTHTRLWTDNIKGTSLLNDDNPVLRLIDNKLLVYGSPWSGKTKCYKNQSFKVGGIVRLAQKPYNKICRLGTLESYACLISSCSVFRHSTEMERNISETVSAAVGLAPCYMLECLPNAEAAELSYATLTSSVNKD